MNIVSPEKDVDRFHPLNQTQKSCYNWKR